MGSFLHGNKPSCKSPARSNTIPSWLICIIMHKWILRNLWLATNCCCYRWYTYRYPTPSQKLARILLRTQTTYYQCINSMWSILKYSGSLRWKPWYVPWRQSIQEVPARLALVAKIGVFTRTQQSSAWLTNSISNHRRHRIFKFIKFDYAF